MTNFVLDKIQLRNVRKYGDDMMEMDFPLNNLTVFTGKVGAGKSTILKAVSMALYGEDGGAKNQKLTIDDLLNEKNKKNLEIHLYFHSYHTDDIGDSSVNTYYEIHLFHKHSKYNNKLVFVKDGKDISLASKTETYELIEKTLIPSSVYHNTYYFTQQCKNFFTSLSNSEQKEIFNSILDLSEYESYYENAKKKLDELKKKFELLNSSYLVQQERVKNIGDSIENKKIEYDKKIKDYRDRISYLEQTISDLKTETDKLAEQIESFGNVDDELVSLEMQKQERRINMESETKKLKDDYAKLLNDFDDNDLPRIKQKYIDLRNERSKELQSQIEKLTSENEKSKIKTDKDVSDIDVKYSKIESDKKEQLANEISKKQDDIKQVELKISELDSVCSQEIYRISDILRKKNDAIRAEITEVSITKSRIEAGLETFRNQFSECKAKITEYKTALDKPDAICSLCGQKLSNKDHIQKHIDELTKKLEEIRENGLKTKEALDNATNHYIELNNQFNDNQKEFYDEEQKLKDKKFEDSKGFREKLEELKNEVFTIRQRYDVEFNKIEQEKKVEKDALLLSYMQITNKNTEEIQQLKVKQLEIDNQIKQEYRVELDSVKEQVNQKTNELKIKIQDCTTKYNTFIDSEYTPKYNELESKKEQCNMLGVEQAKLVTIINEYTHEIDVINNNIENETSAYNLYMEDRNKGLQLETGRLNFTQSEISKVKKEMEILEFWKVAFSDSGIKSMLIDSAIPHMNECVSKELEKTAPGKFTVSFDTLSETKSGKIKDKFSINILNNETQSTGHKKLSGGEMRIVDLCCMSALRELAEKLYGKRFFHIFYDEILDSLDDESKQMFCANVKMQSTSGRNITLITHDLPEDVDPDRVFPF